MLETAIREFEHTAINTDDKGVWIEALPARIYKTPQYGEVPVTVEKLQKFVQNFRGNVRGQEIAIDFDHKEDRAKGNKASGWFKDLDIRPSSDNPDYASLWARVEFTEEAQKEIEDKQWRYFSLEWEDEWFDNDGNTFNDVITGGAITNRPIAKRTLPINFSEALWNTLDDETKVEFAVWSTAYVNNLPNSAFLYVEPGKDDGDGKRVPRSLRHLPYKDSNGKIDLPHLRNAIARIPQMKGISDSLKNSLQARARKLLGGSSKMAESTLSDEVRSAVLVLEQQGLDASGLFDGVEYVAESKEWEHSDPGTGTPPAPRTDEDNSDDPAIKERWRIETPPAGFPLESPTPEGSSKPIVVVNPNPITLKGGKTVGELTESDVRELYRIMEVDTDKNGDDLVAAAKIKFGEFAELKKTVDAVNEEKQFAEKYPAYWEQHNRLMERDRSNSAKTFSESVSKIRKTEGLGLKETHDGLSAQALTVIQETHMKFAEGKATIEDYEKTIKTIVNGGIVKFGEIGSSSEGDPLPEYDTTSATGVAAARRLFGEVVAKVQRENDGMGYMEAVAEATKRHPDLAEAYKIALPA